MTKEAARLAVTFLPYEEHMRKSALQFFLVCILFSLVSPSNAHAYFDPGTGSILLQTISAGVLGVLVFWGKIKRAVKSLFSKRDQPQ